MDANERLAELHRLSKLKFEGWEESAVREEFITPLLRLLGYRIDTDYDVNREKQHLLHRRFAMVGRKKIAIDYKLVVRKRCFWIIEAKAPSEEISDEDVFQAYLYAVHPEVQARYFVVCNGVLTSVYDVRSTEDNPELEFEATDLPSVFPKLLELLGASSIVVQLSERLLADLRGILSVELLQERADKLKGRLNSVFPEMMPIIRENAMAIRRAKFAESNADWQQLVDSATTSASVVSVVLMTATSLYEFSVAEAAFLRRFESESKDARLSAVRAVIGLLSQTIPSVHRANLMRMLIRLSTVPRK